MGCIWLIPRLRRHGQVVLERRAAEGESPVQPMCSQSVKRKWLSNRVGLLGNAALTGGKPHLRLNNGGRPIANNYREGKMERTLKRECQGLETATGEANCGMNICGPNVFSNRIVFGCVFT